MVFAAWYGGEMIIEEQQNSFEFQSNSSWLNVVPFSRIFAVQGFFMIVFVYLKERSAGDGKTKQKRARSVFVYSAMIIAVNAFMYGFCDAKELYFRLDKPFVYIWDLGFVLLGFILILIQIPFKFYLTKEFLFVLYDEIKNKGLSSKIEDLRDFSNNESPHYSELQIEKVREDLYQIVRMPFMKFSNTEYYSLTSIAYFSTVAFMFLVNAFVGLEKEGPLS